MLTNYQIKTIMLMHELENTLVLLYELLSEKFPEYDGSIWNTLIKEEKEHAEGVRKLYRLTYEGHSMFDGGNLKNEAIQSVINFIMEICERHKNKDLTAVQALTHTYDVEVSMVERKLFRFFQASEKYSELLIYLRRGSEKHAQMVKQELDKARKEK